MHIIMIIIPLFDTGLTFYLFWVQIKATTDADKERMQRIILKDDATLIEMLNTALVANDLKKLAGNPGATFVLCVL
jgi:hypothetical protein